MDPVAIVAAATAVVSLGYAVLSQRSVVARAEGRAQEQLAGHTTRIEKYAADCRNDLDRAAAALRVDLDRAIVDQRRELLAVSESLANFRKEYRDNNIHFLDNWQQVLDRLSKVEARRGNGPPGVL